MSPTRDFTFVTDTVKGFVKAAEADAAIGQEINLGTGKEISIGELARKIAGLAAFDVVVRHTNERTRPDKSEVRRLLSNNRKAKELLGWEPRTTLDQGLAATMEWVKAKLEMYDPDTYRI